MRTASNGSSTDTATITEREMLQVERANQSARTPVVFIHGLWLLPSSWDNWAQLFERGLPSEQQRQISRGDAPLKSDATAASRVRACADPRLGGLRFGLRCGVVVGAYPAASSARPPR
jgi:hypothetical protein